MSIKIARRKGWQSWRGVGWRVPSQILRCAVWTIEIVCVVLFGSPILPSCWKRASKQKAEFAFQTIHYPRRLARMDLADAGPEPVVDSIGRRFLNLQAVIFVHRKGSQSKAWPWCCCRYEVCYPCILLHRKRSWAWLDLRLKGIKTLCALSYGGLEPSSQSYETGINQFALYSVSTGRKYLQHASAAYLGYHNTRNHVHLIPTGVSNLDPIC